MLVRMKTQCGGLRDGEPWPAIGETIDVPDPEGVDLVANGYAELVVDEVDAETAPADEAAPAPKSRKR